jgi:hypothetical protein
VRVAVGDLDVLVARERLHGGHRHASPDERAAEVVAQGVEGPELREAEPLLERDEHGEEVRTARRAPARVRDHARKRKLAGARGPEYREERRGDRDVADRVLRLGRRLDVLGDRDADVDDAAVEVDVADTDRADLAAAGPSATPRAFNVACARSSQWVTSGKKRFRARVDAGA